MRVLFLQPKLELYRLYCVLCALKLHLIGVRNLKAEVDMKYIKGMLSNPDIAPSVSINCWILFILMFHFTLVHVPGVQYRPVSLSRHRPQPGDEAEPEDNFEDWINNLNGFLHFINPLPSYNLTIREPLSTSPPITIYLNQDYDREATQEPEEEQEEQKEIAMPYSIIPRTENMVKADKHLIEVQHWLETLERPDALSDVEYKMFM